MEISTPFSGTHAYSTLIRIASMSFSRFASSASRFARAFSTTACLAIRAWMRFSVFTVMILQFRPAALGLLFVLAASGHV